MTTTTHKKPIRTSRILLYAVMLVLAIFFVLPVYLLIITAFKDFSEVSLSRMWDWPAGISLDSFGRAWNGEGTNTEALQNGFANSVLMVIPATVISCLLGSLNGYVLSKWKFKGSETLFTLILFGMFIPYQSILVPLVQTLAAIPFPTISGKLYGSIPGLIFTHVVYGIPITTLIFRNYYANVPKELVEAGQIDGANFFGVYKDIILPLSIPGFVVVAIWQFTSIWNEFLFGLILTNDPRLRPVTVSLQNMSGSQFTEWNVQMAGALIVALPTLLVYIFLGKYFLRGLLAGSLKG
jgi:glucose/mannose transport system permease protein